MDNMAGSGNLAGSSGWNQRALIELIVSGTKGLEKIGLGV